MVGTHFLTGHEQFTRGEWAIATELLFVSQIRIEPIVLSPHGLMHGTIHVTTHIYYMLQNNVFTRLIR